MALPVVAVVGRPNVGKSTLVNRIVAFREAIVHEEPGITRDRNYLETDWRGRSFMLADTGGLVLGSGSKLDQDVTRQALVAVEEAELIIFLVDGSKGLSPAEEEIADTVRKSGKPFILTVNKIDSRVQEDLLPSFYELGLGEPMPVSALHGLGIGELLDHLAAELPKDEASPRQEVEALAVAIVGRPNVGKSSILNRLLGQERAIVSDIPGTTRDATGTLIKLGDKDYYFVDTAGLKRRSRLRESVEYFGSIRTLKALDEADVALIVIDASEGVTEQDQKIASWAKERSCATVIVLNKADLLDLPESEDVLLRQLDRKMPFMSYAPVLKVSALEGRGFESILPSVDEVAEQYRRRIKTAKLNVVWQSIQAKGARISKGGRALKLSYLTQTATAPPHFVFFVNDPRLVGPSERRFFENQLRREFGFTGAPLRLTFRSKRRAKREKAV